MRTNNRYFVLSLVVCLLSISLLNGQTYGQNQKRQSKVGSYAPEGEGEGPSADLSVSKTADSEQVNPGDDITYEITVMNLGADVAENVALNDPLPPSLTFVSITAPMGWTCTTPAVGNGGTVTCTNPSLALSEGEVFTIVVHVPTNAPPGNFFSNTATISTTTFDPNEENNSATASTLVAGSSAEIAVSKTASSDQVVVGRPVTYTITVTNAGPDAAENASLVDNLPAEVTFLSLTQPDGWICMTPAIGAGGTVSCTRSSLPVTSGDAFNLAVAVRSDTPPDTMVVNTATVGTSTPESTDENNAATAFFTAIGGDPTAANGRIAGTIVDAQGRPLAGVTILLSGTQSRRTITDADGSYKFAKVETNGFYTVTPSRANYGFTPGIRSFSLAGNHNEETFSAIFTGDLTNPLDSAEYFVRQQYVDVLGREPDEAGFNYWSDQINACGEDAECIRSRRVDVAAAFFIENEFRQSGAFIYNVYESALGRRLVYQEYSSDRSLVVGGPTLDDQKLKFAEAFTRRAEFLSRYENKVTAETFVDALLANATGAGIDLIAQRDSLIARYERGTTLSESRAFVLRDLSDNGPVREANYNSAFVLVGYFGYLHRTPERAGFDFWLNALNESGRNSDLRSYRSMVCSFITSSEYQRRFSVVESHSNSECGE